MATLRIEIRAGEGGEDAKHLVREQARIYQAYAATRGLTVHTEPSTGSV